MHLCRLIGPVSTLARLSAPVSSHDLRDSYGLQARIGFEGATELATGHWGCGAYGNNHDLMFLKQWLAASEAGVRTMHYHDFSRSQSHHILPLVRRCQHLSVGQLWAFLLELTTDLQPCNMPAFCSRISDLSVGRLKVPTCQRPQSALGCGADDSDDMAGGQTAVCSEVHSLESKVLPTGLAPLATASVDRGAAAGPPSSVEPTAHSTSEHLPLPHTAQLPSATAAITLKELRLGIPVGVDAVRKEEYLSSAEFEAVFSMSLADFNKLPKWKRDVAKKQAGLF